MKCLGFKTFALILFGTVLVAADPFLTITFRSLELNKLVENPYIVNFTSAITKVGKQTPVSAGLDVLEFPSELEGKIQLTVNGLPIPVLSGNLCYLLENDVMIKMVIAAAEPRNRLLKGCPIAPGRYMLRDYVVDTKAIPLGLIPDCRFTSVTSLLIPGEEPFLVFTLTGSASHFGIH